MTFALKVVQVFAILSAAVAALSPRSAPAQGALEEIIVTAERREATELTSALSLEVFTGADLAADRLETVMDLEKATPNLTIAHTGGGTQSVNIRGVGNSVVNPNIQPGLLEERRRRCLRTADRRRPRIPRVLRAGRRNADPVALWR